MFSLVISIHMQSLIGRPISCFLEHYSQLTRFLMSSQEPTPDRSLLTNVFFIIIYHLVSFSHCAVPGSKHTFFKTVKYRSSWSACGLQTSAEFRPVKALDYSNWKRVSAVHKKKQSITNHLNHQHMQLNFTSIVSASSTFALSISIYESVLDTCVNRSW